ncbi:MAG: MlaE family ABC transporter permease [Puniceicoccaceae bacterium]
MERQTGHAGITLEPDRIVIHLSGHWSVHSKLPSAQELIDQIKAADSALPVHFVLDQETSYDTVLASFVYRLLEASEAFGHAVELTELPQRLLRLLELGRKVPMKEDAQKDIKPKRPFLEEVGHVTMEHLRGSLAIATFTGEWLIALGNLLIGRAHIRWKDFWHILRTVSVDALPIVALISFLVGVIISFLGAVTLKQFGAEFAVAYLVGFGILREMGAIMTGVIMAGRTGAAFAAQIGSMKVNEEIDALKTLGISPIEFIVLPRLLALFIMMPLLTLYANVIGILSGWVVAEGLMGVPGPVYFSEMQYIVGMEDFFLGIFKACVFGVLVSTAGCIRGLQSGSGADAVGVAATRAVVAGITLIVFSNAVIDWAAATLGI